MNLPGRVATAEGDSRPRRLVVPQLTGSTCLHGDRPGLLDESARRLSHEELAVARQLAEEGHTVRSLAERPGHGPTSDLAVCGAAVEVKAFLSLAERPGGTRPSARSVCNKLLDASRQAPSAVLYGRGSGLDEGTTRRGVRLFAERGGFERLSAVRVLGDRFDVSWGTPGRIASRIPQTPERGRYYPAAQQGLGW